MDFPRDGKCSENVVKVSVLCEGGGAICERDCVAIVNQGDFFRYTYNRRTLLARSMVGVVFPPTSCHCLAKQMYIHNPENSF